MLSLKSLATYYLYFYKISINQGIKFHAQSYP